MIFVDAALGAKLSKQGVNAVEVRQYFNLVCRGLFFGDVVVFVFLRGRDAIGQVIAIGSPASVVVDEHFFYRHEIHVRKAMLIP